MLQSVISNFMIQYGKWTDAGTVSFPISYSQEVSLTYTGQYNWNQSAKVTSLTLTSFKISCSASTDQTGIRNWIAVGY